MSCRIWGIRLVLATLAAGACEAAAVSKPSAPPSETKSSSWTSVSVTVTNGTATSQASSVSEGSAVGSDEIVTKVVDAFTNVENGGNVTTEANLAAKAIGTTLATAFTESRTKVNVTGEGFAKAESSGSAEAYALATAKAIALGVTEAANLQQRSYSRVNVTALSSEIVRSVVSVSSSINSTGGAKQELKTRIAVATATPIAQAIASVLAQVRDGVASVLNTFGVHSNQGEVPVTETSSTDGTQIGTELFPITDAEIRVDEVTERIRRSVASAVTDAILHAAEGKELRSSDGKAFAFAFSFAGADVSVAGHGVVPGGGCGEMQEIAELSANGVALALAGTQHNETGSIAEVQVKVDPISNGAGPSSGQASSQATVEPIAQALSGVLTAVRQDVARSKSVSFASGSSDSQEAIDIEAEVDADRESEGFDPRIVEDAGQSYTEDIHQDKPAHVESDDCCYYAIRYEPFAVCGKHCDPRVCNRGYGVYKSMEACCQKGNAFKGGCNPPPEECYVAEDHKLRTCRRDDTKCLQGSQMWGSMEECCGKGAAFKDGCSNIDRSGKKCWAVRGYWPTKDCYQTSGICDRGWGIWKTQLECCGKGGAFKNGCDAPLPVPCWIRDMYHPIKLCREDKTIGTCYRGWGTYGSREECCSPGAAFPEGCSK